MDGIHPNQAGHIAIEMEIWRKLNQFSKLLLIKISKIFKKYFFLSGSNWINIYAPLLKNLPHKVRSINLKSLIKVKKIESIQAS